MTTKPKCDTQNCERDVFAKGLCSGCYGRQWREQRKAERAVKVEPKQLTDGAVEAEIVPAIEGEIVLSETHLTAVNPTEMQAVESNLKPWLEIKLAEIEQNIVECNRALNEAKDNGWSTSALTAARNRAVDDETFYNKILLAVEAGHTIIPDFPISIFAIRRSQPDQRQLHTWTGHVSKSETWLSNPARPDYAPAGAGEYRNPRPEVNTWFSYMRKNAEGQEYRPYNIERTGRPVGPIVFPSQTARSPIMRATADAMAEKTFDQIGVCLPVAPDALARRVQENAGRAGDPIVIGQVVRKGMGGRHRVVSFIIAWYLNLNEL